MKAALYKLQVTSYELRANGKLRVTSYKLQVASFKLNVTIYTLQIARALEAFDKYESGAISFEEACNSLNKYPTTLRAPASIGLPVSVPILTGQPKGASPPESRRAQTPSTAPSSRSVLAFGLRAPLYGSGAACTPREVAAPDCLRTSGLCVRRSWAS